MLKYLQYCFQILQFFRGFFLILCSVHAFVQCVIIHYDVNVFPFEWSLITGVPEVLCMCLIQTVRLNLPSSLGQVCLQEVLCLTRRKGD